MAELCTEELFEQAERSFDKRKFGSENLLMAERQLSKVVSLCGDYAGSFRAKIRLGVVREELADHNLRIALFYLDKSFHGKGGKAGGVSRLKSIIERYPEFSKLDQVLFLLGEINLTDRNFDEAAGYYKTLIGQYPGSQYVGEASMRLSATDVWKIETSQPPIPIIGNSTNSTILGQERTSSARLVLEYSKCRQGDSGCINAEDEWARLDSVGNDLRANLNLHAYVIGYAARDALPGSGLRHAHYVRNLLRRLVADDARVRVLDGGRRENLTIQVWLAPFGVVPPNSSSPVLAEAANNTSALKFDEFYPPEYKEEEVHFSEYKYYDQSAVLDGFALLLEREPTLKGYIIAYDGHRDRSGTAYKFAQRYWQYLYDTNLLGNNPRVDTNEPSRIVIVRGSRRKNRLIELWAVPPNASVPGLRKRLLTCPIIAGASPWVLKREYLFGGHIRHV